MIARLAGVVLVVLATGCGAKPCEVAKAFCADGAIDCEVARATFAAAELPDAACVDALEVLRVAEKGPADMRSMIKVTVLQELMKQSPKLSPAQVEALGVQARAIAEVNAAEADGPGPRFVGYLEVPEPKPETKAETKAGGAPSSPPPPTK